MKRARPRPWLAPGALLVAVALFLVQLGLPAPSGRSDSHFGGLGVVPALAKTRTELSEELLDNKQQLKETREKIERAEAVRRAALGEIAVLDQRIESIEEELADVSTRRDAVAVELAATREELDRLKAAVEERRAVLDKAQADLLTAQGNLEARAVDIYKAGRLGNVELLFGTSRLAELVNRFDLLSKILEQDDAVVLQIEELRSRVSEEKAGLEAEQVRVGRAEEEQSARKAELDALVQEERDSLERLSSARADKRDVVTKAETDQAAWEKQEESLKAESERLGTELRSLGGGQVSVQGTGRFIRPIPGRVSSGFGYRVHPIFKVRRMHTGVDMSGSSGTPIRAADRGTVVQAGWRGGYGKTVVIAHGNGLTTLYAHQSAIMVGVGSIVNQGDVIGRVGSTGYSTGPHLHFEVRVGGRPVDPMGYL
jgi:murein DD-endopeptidase MepM/ murein hydrolase activator NlpD